MDKKNRLFFSFFFISLLSLGVISSLDCIDSDGGAFYEIQGTTYGIKDSTGILGNFTDTCMLNNETNEFYLIEYVCDDKEEGIVNGPQFFCLGGCLDGVCNMTDPKNEVVEYSSMNYGYCKGKIACEIFKSESECESSKEMINYFEETINNTGFFRKQGLCVWDEKVSKCIGKTPCVALNSLNTEKIGSEDFCNSRGASYKCKWTTQEAKSFFEKVKYWFRDLFF